MSFLSKQIEAHAKKRNQQEKSLIKKEYSCGIFQDYGTFDGIEAKTDEQVQK